MSLWLTDPGLRVVEESDRFSLEADEFEPLSQAAAVREAAARLLPRINGVGKLKSASFQDVGLGLVQEDDSGTVRKHAFLQLDAIRIRSRVSPVVIRVGDEQAGPSVPGAQESDAWVRAAASHPNKQRALALWGGPHDPTSLWKVWELVRESGMTIDSDERRRFRPALNDRAISGEDARHDVSRRYPADPDTPGVLSDTRRDRPAPETLAAPAGLLGRADVERLRRVRARSGGCACARRRWRSCARRDTSLPQRSCARVVNEVSDAVVGLGPSSSC
jgi:hypothetical protein